MRRRIDNIQELIDKLEDDTLLGHLSVNRYPGIDWENLTWENLDMVKVREDINEEIKTGSFSCQDAIEEYLCKCNVLSDVFFNEQYKLDMTIRCSDWMTPLISIFKYYGYGCSIDYVNECILMDMEDNEDFSTRIGIDIEKLLEYGAYNSFMYYEHQEDIDKLYDRVRRNDKIQKIRKNITTPE